MGKLVLIPGLGADKRVYKKIDLAGYNLVYIDWLIPELTDTLSSYAKKLIDAYNIVADDIVIGNSLGGMLAMEIAKQVKLSKTILISSIRTVKEAPWYFKVFKNAPVYNLIPDKAFSHLGVGVKTVFGDMLAEDLELFKDMISQASPLFMKWAMNAILHWTNEVIPPNVYQIIGDADRVFPLNNNMQPILIKGGTHIMIFDKAEDVTVHLKEILLQK